MDGSGIAGAVTIGGATVGCVVTAGAVAAGAAEMVAYGTAVVVE